MKLIGHLKSVKRAGWVRKEVDNPESVAEHMYRMAMMALALPPDSGLDRDKCIKIALVHDMAETIVGDITPFEDVDKKVKHKQEKEATSHISNLLGNEVGTELFDLWMEYETQSTPEAKFVKDLDKLEMLYQAYEYETAEGSYGRLQEFFDHTKKTRPTMDSELAETWRKDLVEMREKVVKESKSGGCLGDRSPGLKSMPMPLPAVVGREGDAEAHCEEKE